MVSIYFLHKLFLIATIFMIILTSVSTIELYQMVKDENENYENYLNKQLQTYEIKMEIENFYDTIHNLLHRRIPAPFGEYNYEAYKNKLTEYCEYEYVTFKRFKRDNKVTKFKYVLMDLKTCIDDIIKTVENAEELKKDMIKALEWTPDASEKKFSGSIIKIATSIRSCLDENYNNDDYENPSFVDCLVDHNIKEDNSSKNYAAKLIENINKNVLSPNQFKEFDSCIRSYKKKFSNIFHSKKGLHRSCSILRVKDDITLKELYLTESLIYHPNKDLNDIDLSKLSEIYGKSKEIEITQSDKEYCKETINTMDYPTYTSTKMSYLILPGLWEHNNLQFYKTRRNKIIDELANIDIGNIGYYDGIKKNTEKITEPFLKSMIKRRAMKEENNYNGYVMRMNIRGYLPLSKNLWNQEFLNSKKNELETITNQELTVDLRNDEISLLSEIKNDT